MDHEKEEDAYFRKLSFRRFSKMVAKKNDKVEAIETKRREIAESGFAHYLSEYLTGWHPYRLVSKYDEKLFLFAPYAHYILAYYVPQGDMQDVVLIIDNEKQKNKPVKEITLEAIDSLTKDIVQRLRWEKSKRKAKLSVKIIEITDIRLENSRQSELSKIKKSILKFDKTSFYYFHVDTNAKEVWSNSKYFIGYLRTGFYQKLLTSPVIAKKDLSRSAGLYGINPEAKPILGLLFSFVYVLTYLIEVWFVGDSSVIFSEISGSKLAKFGGLIFQEEQEWAFSSSLMTHSFLHYDLNSLLGSCFGIVLAGFIVERLLGRSWFLFLSLLGVFSGAIGFYFSSLPNVVLSGPTAQLICLLTVSLLLLINKLPLKDEAMLYAVFAVAFLTVGLIPSSGLAQHYPNYAGLLVGILAWPFVSSAWVRGELSPKIGVPIQLLGVASAFLVMASLLTLSLSFLNFQG